MIQVRKEMPQSLREELKDVVLMRSTPENDTKIVSAYNEYLELDYMKPNCEPCTNYARMMLKRFLVQK